MFRDVHPTAPRLLSDRTSKIDPRLSVYLETSVHAFPQCWPTFRDDFDSYKRQAHNVGRCFQERMSLREKRRRLLRRSRDERNGEGCSCIL